MLDRSDVSEKFVSCDRRAFLRKVSAGGIVAGFGGYQVFAEQEAASEMLSTIAIGPYRVTRLVAGWNPIGGYSYLGHHMDQHMREYFTVERTVEFLLNCERAGINTHQFSPSDKMPEVIRRLRDQGSRMQLICLCSGQEGVKEMVESTRPIAMAHHGGVTDRLFAEGKSQLVHDFVKQVHDLGVLAGVSAHNPDCIKKIADEGWEVDFFMCCFYFLTRKDPPPISTLEVSYAFYADDPSVMTSVMRQVTQPCLGFKILAAGRKCLSQQMVRDAFQFAFDNIKPTDGVIVGMYPRFFDEITANVGYTRQFARTGKVATPS